MKYLTAIDPQQRVDEPVDVDEPVRRIESPRRSNRAVGIAVAAGVAIVGLGWGGHAFAPPATTDRGADSAAAVDPPLRASGADLAAPTAPPFEAGAGGDTPRPRNSTESTDTTVVVPGLSVTWSVARRTHGAVFRVTGLVDPEISRVVVRIEHGGRSLASATTPAALEDERTGPDGRPRGRSRFTATLVVRGGLPASGLRLDVEWGDDGATGIGTIGWPLLTIPADDEHVGLRATPGRHRG